MWLSNVDGQPNQNDQSLYQRVETIEATIKILKARIEALEALLQNIREEIVSINRLTERPIGPNDNQVKKDVYARFDGGLDGTHI